MITELSISYGLPCTVILIILIVFILINSFKILYIKEKSNINDKAFFVASTVFIFSQLVDIQYFDGRISIVFWLLLAGLKCIIDEKSLISNA